MTTVLLDRAALGMRAPSGSYTPFTPDGITLHYGGPSPWGIPWSNVDDFLRLCDHRRCPSIWRAWQDFHMSPGALGTVAPAHPIDIAYTSGVCPHGVRFEGRGAGHRTAAQGTNQGNARSYAVVYVAGENDPLTDGAKLAYLDERDRLGKPIMWVHSDWHSTGCPGVPVHEWKLAGCPRPGVTEVPVHPVPVVPPLIAVSTPYELEDSVKIVTTRYPVPALKDGNGYWDLDGAPGRPLVASIDLLVGSPTVNGGDGYPDVSMVHGVEPFDYNGHVRLRLWGFEKGAAPLVLVSALVS